MGSNEDAMVKRWAGSRCVWAAVWAWVTFLLGTHDAGAAPFAVEGRDWEGLADFVSLARDELGDGRVRVETSLVVDELSPADGIFLVQPTGTVAPDALATFLNGGGRVVLFDDFGDGDGVLAHFGLKRVTLVGEPREQLRGNPGFALAEPADGHPVAQGVHRVVTNHASGMAPRDLSPVLKVRNRAGTETLLAQAGLVGRGRLLAVGDGSILINRMLAYPGNRTFARNAVRYAVEDDTWGSRGGTLHILVGSVRLESGSSAKAPWMRAARQRTDGLLRAVRHADRVGWPPPVAFALAVGLGLILVLWVGRRATKLHSPRVPRFARSATALEQGGLAGHAAVLASPSVPASLVLLECKSAIEEGLRLALDLPEHAGHDVLVHAAHNKGFVDAEGQARMRRLLLELSMVETDLLAKRHRRRSNARETLASARWALGVVQAANELKEGVS